MSPRPRAYAGPGDLARRIAIAKFAQARPFLVATADHRQGLASGGGFRRRFTPAARHRPADHRQRHVHPGPGAEQAEGKCGGQPYAFDGKPAAPRQGDGDVGACRGVRADVDEHQLGVVGGTFQADARRVGGVFQRHEQPRMFAGKGVDGADGAHHGADEVAMTQVHRDQAEAGQQEGDQHGHAVRIVEAREQHHQQQSREGHAAAGRQDVHAPRAHGDRQAILALAAFRPGRDAPAQAHAPGCLPPFAPWRTSVD